VFIVYLAYGILNKPLLHLILESRHFYFAALGYYHFGLTGSVCHHKIGSNGYN
jgi:hypothetical protein